eukprot:tig00000789_g4136.t1
MSLGFDVDIRYRQLLTADGHKDAKYGVTITKEFKIDSATKIVFKDSLEASHGCSLASTSALILFSPGDADLTNVKDFNDLQKVTPVVQFEIKRKF